MTASPLSPGVVVDGCIAPPLLEVPKGQHYRHGAAGASSDLASEVEASAPALPRSLPRGRPSPRRATRRGGTWFPVQLASRSVSLPLAPKSFVRHTAISSVVSRSFGWKPRPWY